MGQEEDHFGMRTERMRRAELKERILVERGDPMRIGLIDLSWKSDEGGEVILILYFLNLEFLPCHPIGS
jgi:hypothetical protein